MTWWKNGLLLAAGGVAGLVLAAFLTDDNEGSSNTKPLSEDEAIEFLVNKIRKEAEWAIEECSTDEEREKVYAEVNASIEDLKSKLQQHGEEIIADLKKQIEAMDTEEEENSGNDQLVQYRSTLEKLLKTLDETQQTIKPAEIAPAQ